MAVRDRLLVYELLSDTAQLCSPSSITSTNTMMSPEIGGGVKQTIDIISYIVYIINEQTNTLCNT